jgi:hypothetical protein
MKRFLAAMSAALLMVALVSSTVFASSAKWMIYSYSGDSGPIPGVATNPHAGTIATFPFSATPDQALLTSDANGYVKNGGLLGKTVTATFSITAPAGTTFVGYDNGCSTPPTVRFYFDTKLNLGTPEWGVYTASLWWSNPVSISLADVLAAGPTTLSVSVDPALWSDTDGTFGNADVADFNAAASNVNKIGFSFGSGCSFAFGDGSNPAGALFNLMKFSTH